MSIFKTAAATAAIMAAGAVSAAAQTQVFQSQGAPDMCLSMEVGAVAIRPCTDSVTQSFTVSPTFDGTGFQLIIGNEGLVMGAENQMLASKTLGGSEQSTGFTFASNGAISAGGLCIDVKGGGRRAGTPVIGFRCNGQVNQRWTRADSARAPVRGKTQATGGRLVASHAPNMCLSSNAAGQLIIENCETAPDFSLVTGGAITTVTQLRTYQCLTAPAVSGQIITLGQNCDAEQRAVQWGFTEKGLLRSADGLCADVKGGGKATGTPVIAFACSGDPNQRFQLIPNQ